MTLVGPMRIKSPFFLNCYHPLLRTMMPVKALRALCQSRGESEQKEQYSVGMILLRASKGWIKMVMDSMKKSHVFSEMSLARVSFWKE